MWRQIAHYMRGKTVLEFEGIPAEELQTVLQVGALRRLNQVQEIVFSEEWNSEEKVQALQAWFLEQSPLEN